MQSPHFGSKITIRKKMSKSMLQTIERCFLGKTAPKKHSIFEKQVHFENRPSSKGCSNAKSSLWVKNYNSKKHVKIHCTNHLELFCAEDRSKRH